MKVSTITMVIWNDRKVKERKLKERKLKERKLKEKKGEEINGSLDHYLRGFRTAILVTTSLLPPISQYGTLDLRP